MKSGNRQHAALAFLLAFAVQVPAIVCAQSGSSTRVESPDAHHRKGPRSYPYRLLKDYVLQELDLRPGDVVVDVGAGDGWWSEHFARAVGEEGVVYAAEIDDKKVESMKKRFRGLSQVRPYLCEKDGTGLEENSCDLAFFSQSFHHLPLEKRVEYLRGLKKVIRPTGRLVVIEKYARLASDTERHGTDISTLTSEAEKAGWVLVRYELMVGTYHYLAILVQKELFPPQKRRPEQRRPRRQRF